METKEKERQGRRWLIYFGAAKIWIRVRAPCLKLPTYKLSFIPSLSSLIFSNIDFSFSLRSSISLRAPIFSLSLSLDRILCYIRLLYTRIFIGRDLVDEELRKKGRIAPFRAITLAR